MTIHNKTFHHKTNKAEYTHEYTHATIISASGTSTIHHQEKTEKG